MRRKHTRPTVTRLPMMPVYHASTGALFDAPRPLEATLSPVGTHAVELADAPSGRPHATYTSATAALADHTPARSGGGRRRCKTATTTTPPRVEAPVVVHVPLPDLERPIVAHLDANHQIVASGTEAAESHTKV